MSITLGNISLGTYIQMVSAASNIIDKAEETINKDEIVSMQLHEGMKPFTFQVFSIVHHSVGAIEALKTGEFGPPKMPDNLSFEDLKNMLKEAEKDLKSMNSSEIDTTTIEAIDESRKDDLQDPFNSSVSDFQKQRSVERRLRMKEFNYKFNKSKISDIENEPAYKRRGVELENKNYSKENEISRTSISLDENDDMKIRKNNSFLHDNVD